ncbi:uncharacterized protein N7503_001683 [Penicillium pulvis]|uniref:uncharacterized protein n=1 Tax=Penicillium pulvis TaxID=1562058 RepID=UPI002547F2D9|nr:uncharacterized protein N7503_001683 [Penicillium pulvis]KAJ5809465.1 hypothetical protein N7503_001683 [Penicillium pulvis]
MFSKIYSAAENESTDVRFLSRYDKSATNIKESELWINIGQIAIRLGEFTITDRGTYLTLIGQQKPLKGQTKVYKTGESEVKLLSPGHLLVGRKARDKDLARDFVKWVMSESGQAVIANFHHKDDKACLYKPYPSKNEVQPSDCEFVPLEGLEGKMEL